MAGGLEWGGDVSASQIISDALWLARSSEQALFSPVNDFAKAKILFALALVAVLFALHSVVRDFSHEGISFFGVVVQFRFIYFMMLGLLGCVIYFYAIDFITDNPLGLAHRVGNLFYAITLLFPPVFAIVFLSIKVAEGVVWISSSPLAGEISKLAIALIASGAGLLIAKIASATLNLRDRQHTVDRLAFESRAHLKRAEELMEAGHYDLVALEGYRCVESVLQRSLLNDNVHVPSTRPNQLIPTASKAGIIPEDLVGIFHELRIARNRAVHTSDQFSGKDASWFLATTRKMVSSVRASRKAEQMSAFAEIAPCPVESSAGSHSVSESANTKVADVAGVTEKKKDTLPPPEKAIPPDEREHEQSEGQHYPEVPVL